jgi:hypothetical protein
MKKVILKCDVENIDSLNELPNFENVWSYHPEESIENCYEFGRIKTEKFVFKILAYQPERSKREDVILEKLIEKVIFARNDAIILEKSISVDILTDILDYLTMRCSELYGDIERPAEKIWPA